MANPYFQFKKFVVRQDCCAMKVGTDGVLLGAWANVEGSVSVLDIGAGTGLLSLMVTQRSDAVVTAVEIDVAAAEQASENVSESIFKDRIHVLNISLQEYVKGCGRQFDFIISNPPYFKDSLKSPKGGRTMARHTDSLSFEELLEGVGRLLSDEGTFAMILPFQEKERFIELASRVGLFPKRLLDVCPTPDVQPKRFLAEFSKKKQDVEQHILVIESEGRHQYSEEYKRLTADFYLR